MEVVVLLYLNPLLRKDRLDGMISAYEKVVKIMKQKYLVH